MRACARLYMTGKLLHLRLPQMSLLRGWSARSKLLMVQGLSTQVVYNRQGTLGQINSF